MAIDEKQALAAKEAPRKRNQGVKKQSFLAERLEWGGLCLVRLLLAPFSARGRSRLMGRIGGALGPWLGFARRIEANIDLVRPDYDAATRRRITRGVMANFASAAIEYMDLPALYEASEGFSVEGLEHLQAAREAGGGKLVVVSAHYGNWEAARAVAARHGAPLAIIYRAFNNRKMDDYSHRLITACGWPAYRKGAEGSRELFKHVRGGGGAMILVDQRLGGAPQLDFMGRPAETSLAAAQLALKLKAPLLPAAARRTETGFHVIFEPPIPPSDPMTMTEAVNKVIEGWIDAAPEQWFWLHRRWRLRKIGRRRLQKRGEAAIRTYGRDNDPADPS